MAPRLKVFVTSDGLTDYVVATTSKAKALAAWGVHQDVFKTGLAHEADDPEVVAAATASPGEVLRRPASTRGELAKLKPAKASAKAKAPSKAALAKVADLERKLAELNEAQARTRAELARARADLDRREAKVEADHAARREALETKLSAARQALG